MKEIMLNSKPIIKILLVEDHTVVRMLAKQFLIKKNFKVDAVADGASALLLAIENEYDLILMDLKLPNIDGFGATKVIRALKNKNATIPILALTSSEEKEVSELMKAAGMNGYIGKPFTPSDLCEKIAKHLSM